MDIKKVIKKFKKKDLKHRFLIIFLGIITTTKWFTLESLTKYLKSNELNIEKISIKLIVNKKEVK